VLTRNLTSDFFMITEGAKVYREIAVELRAMAGDTTDKVAREVLFSCANDYDQMAAMNDEKPRVLH
jgi:hypothetical protein